MGSRNHKSLLWILLCFMWLWEESGKKNEDNVGSWTEKVEKESLWWHPPAGSLFDSQDLKHVWINLEYIISLPNCRKKIPGSYMALHPMLSTPNGLWGIHSQCHHLNSNLFHHPPTHPFSSHTPSPPTPRPFHSHTLPLHSPPITPWLPNDQHHTHLAKAPITRFPPPQHLLRLAIIAIIAIIVQSSYHQSLIAINAPHCFPNSPNLCVQHSNGIIAHLYLLMCT